MGDSVRSSSTYGEPGRRVGTGCGCRENSVSLSYIIYRWYPEGSLNKSKSLFASLCTAAPQDGLGVSAQVRQQRLHYSISYLLLNLP